MTIREEADEYADKYSDIHEYGGYKNASNAYLAAFEGPTVKALVEALKNIITRTPSDGTVTYPVAVQIAREALQKFQEARKG